MVVQLGRPAARRDNTPRELLPHEVLRPPLRPARLQLLRLEQVRDGLFQNGGVRLQRTSDFLQPLTCLRADLSEDARADLREVFGGAADALAGASGTARAATPGLARTTGTATARSLRSTRPAPARRTVSQRLLHGFQRGRFHERAELRAEGVDAPQRLPGL